jgi:hypothetical protein
VTQPITIETGIIAIQKMVSQPFRRRLNLGSSWTAAHSVLSICMKRLLPGEPALTRVAVAYLVTFSGLFVVVLTSPRPGPEVSYLICKAWVFTTSRR